MTNDTAGDRTPNSASTPNPPMPAAPDLLLLDELRRLDASMAADGSKHDRVIGLITMCIGLGVQTPKAIVATLTQLDFKARHIGIKLREGMGPNSERHYWWRDADGQLRLHE